MAYGKSTSVPRSPAPNVLWILTCSILLNVFLKYEVVNTYRKIYLPINNPPHREDYLLTYLPIVVSGDFRERCFFHFYRYNPLTMNV